MTKYILDTNLYIRAYRSSSGAAELARFYSSFTPNSYLSSVVLHELLIGAADSAKLRQIHEEIARPFMRTGRLVTPSHSAWQVAAEAIARLAWAEGLDRQRMPKSFVNDVILAASCREAGITLVTDNVGDFTRIQPVLPMEFVPPWPT